jgi:hypothetical protein
MASFIKHKVEFFELLCNFTCVENLNGIVLSSLWTGCHLKLSSIFFLNSVCHYSHNLILASGLNMKCGGKFAAFSFGICKFAGIHQLLASKHTI